MNIVQGLAFQNKKTFSRTKELLNIFFIAAVSRSDFSGKSNQSEAMKSVDASAFAPPEDEETKEPNDSNPDSNKQPGAGDENEAECND